MRIWHLDHRRRTHVVSRPHDPVESVHFSPDCRRVVSISPGEGVAKVWDFTRHPEFATFARTDADVEAIAFSDDGQRLLVRDRWPGKLQIWDGLDRHAAGGTSAAAEQGSPQPGRARVVFRGRQVPGRPHASTMPASSNAGTRPTVPRRRPFKGHTLPVDCVRFSRDWHVPGHGRPARRRIADAPHEIKVWDARHGQAAEGHAGQGARSSIWRSARPARLLAFSGQEGDHRSDRQFWQLAEREGACRPISSVLTGPSGRRQRPGVQRRWTLAGVGGHGRSHGQDLAGRAICWRATAQSLHTHRGPAFDRATWPSVPTTAAWPPSAATWSRCGKSTAAMRC